MQKRDGIKGIIGGIERQMRADQEQALRALAKPGNQPITVVIRDDQGNDRSVRVDLSTISFNFSVNELSSDIISHRNPIANLSNGWSNCRAQNMRAIDSLIGSPKEREAVKDGIGGDFAS